MRKRYLKNFPMNMNKKVGIMFTLKNPKAIPSKSPIKGSQLNKAIHEPYLLTLFFNLFILSKVAPKTFNQYGLPILPIA